MMYIAIIAGICNNPTCNWISGKARIISDISPRHISRMCMIKKQLSSSNG